MAFLVSATEHFNLLFILWILSEKVRTSLFFLTHSIPSLGQNGTNSIIKTCTTNTQNQEIYDDQEKELIFWSCFGLKRLHVNLQDKKQHSWCIRVASKYFNQEFFKVFLFRGGVETYWSLDPQVETWAVLLRNYIIYYNNFGINVLILLWFDID